MESVITYEQCFDKKINILCKPVLPGEQLVFKKPFELINGNSPEQELKNCVTMGYLKVISDVPIVKEKIKKIK